MTDREIQAGAYPLCVETRIGIYGILIKKYEELTTPIRNRLNLSNGASCLEFHVYGGADHLRTFIDDMKRIAELFIRSGLKVDVLYGVTHANVAIPAKKFLNFDLVGEISEGELDAENLRRINEGFSLTKRASAGKERGPIFLLTQPFESFMQKFGNQTDFSSAETMV